MTDAVKAFIDALAWIATKDLFRFALDFGSAGLITTASERMAVIRAMKETGWSATAAREVLRAFSEGAKLNDMDLVDEAGLRPWVARREIQRFKRKQAGVNCEDDQNAPTC